LLSATVMEPVPLQVLAADGRQDLFARIRIYDPAGTVVQTLSGTHLVDGLYSVLWTPSIEGFFTYVAELFFDAGYTVLAGYERQGELVDVNSSKTNILRLLGLAHENSVVDQQVYNSEGDLVSARIRSYDSKASAQLAGVSGLRFTWSVLATYFEGSVSSYKILKET